MYADNALATAALQSADFYQTNQASLNNNIVMVASGKTLNDPSDNSTDYFRVEHMNTTLNGITLMQQGITAGSGMLQVASAAGASVLDDLGSMQGLLQNYYNPQSTTDEQEADIAQFNAIAGNVAETINSTYYDGKQLIADSSGNPLTNVLIDPNDPTQTYQISYDSGDVPDVSGLTLGVSDQATETAALNAQYARAESYVAKTSTYSEALDTFDSLSDNEEQTYTQTIANEQDCNTGDVMAQLTQEEICQQSSLAMLAQATDISQQTVAELMKNF